ncbi:hypothetical protein IEQ34_008157 [Dendrobium chrysotoxum]|uniref:Uncharacterized protein n=1 Tax=Dendrobium chrysotoxum TaxID=161865 RepID=A0AAV7GNY0_DENCH|nr:hypothetical protein IEQ34_008157 [Dendrobium chrysotoxum]
MDEDFTRDFLKGIHLVQSKAKAFEDPSLDLDVAEIESKLRKAFSSDGESMVLMSLLQQGFAHQGEKRKMFDIPDLRTDSWTSESWSKRLSGGDYYVCWPLK